LKNSLPQTAVVDDDKSSLVEEEERQQLQLQQQLQFDAELLIEREDRVRAIETDILDVNELMRELAAQVNEQGAAVGKIS